MQSLINVIMAEKSYPTMADKYFDPFTQYLTKESTIKKWLKTQPPMVEVLTYLLRLKNQTRVEHIGFWMDLHAPYLVPVNQPNDSIYWEAMYNKNFMAIESNVVEWNTTTKQINERKN